MIKGLYKLYDFGLATLSYTLLKKPNIDIKNLDAPNSLATKINHTMKSYRRKTK